MSDTWYYARGGQSQGPVSWAQLQQLSASGGLAPSDLVWSEGMAAWIAASQVPGLVAAAPPPPAYGGQPYQAPGQPIPPQPFPGPQYSNMQGAQFPRGAQDAALSAGEWLICIFCSFIGCIVGIVYLAQGNPKGGKMLGFSILFMIIGGIIRFAAMAALEGRR